MESNCWKQAPQTKRIATANLAAQEDLVSFSNLLGLLNVYNYENYYE